MNAPAGKQAVLQNGILMGWAVWTVAFLSWLKSLLAGVSDNSCVSVFREEKRSLQGIPVCFSERKGHL